MDYYIPINRRIFEHRFWCEGRVFSRFEAWLDILQSARFEDTKQLIGNRLIEVKRGQMLVSLRFLSGRWQWSTKKVNAFLNLLIQDNMITKETPKETGQTVITICNYDKYNSTASTEETQRKQEGNTKETPRKQNINKENKEKKDIVSSRDAACAATLLRKDDFYRSLIPFLGEYPKETLRAFFDYWSEMNKSRTKMRFEQQSTWELGKRLSTWAKREKEYGNPNRNPYPGKQEANDYALQALQERMERRSGSIQEEIPKPF